MLSRITRTCYTKKKKKGRDVGGGGVGGFFFKTGHTNCHEKYWSRSPDVPVKRRLYCLRLWVLGWDSLSEVGQLSFKK